MGFQKHGQFFSENGCYNLRCSDSYVLLAKTFTLF